MKNKNSLVFKISTALLSILMLLSAGFYIFNNAEVSNTFINLGFPTFIIYPLAALKITGVIFLWFGKGNFLREWAYAGFMFNFILALAAHLIAQDGEFQGAALALVLLITSYVFDKKVQKTN